MPLLRHLNELTQRRPNAVHWIAISAVALLALMIVTGMQSRARSAAASWGTSVSVLAAAGPLAAGDTPDETQLKSVEVPAHLVPDGALASPSQVGELTRAVPAGGLLTMLDIDAASSVSPGARGIGISVVAHAPDVRPGTVVELLLFADIDPFDPAASIGAGAGGSGAERVPAVVLAAESGQSGRWFVEIDPAHLDAVARASATGIIVPVIVPTVPALSEVR